MLRPSLDMRKCSARRTPLTTLLCIFPLGFKSCPFIWTLDCLIMSPSRLCCVSRNRGSSGQYCIFAIIDTPHSHRDFFWIRQNNKSSHVESSLQQFVRPTPSMSYRPNAIIPFRTSRPLWCVLRVGRTRILTMHVLLEICRRVIDAHRLEQFTNIIREFSWTQSSPVRH